MRKLSCLLFFLTCILLILVEINIRNTEAVAKNTRKRGLNKNKKTAPAFYVSGKTTYFTEPLLKDGRVDYVAALNRFYKPSEVTPINNGAVYLIKAIGIQEDTDLIHAENQWKEMGLSKDGKSIFAFPTENNDRFISQQEYIKQRLEGLERPEKEKENQRLIQVFYNSPRTPWKKENRPEVWEWIQLNRTATSLVTQGAKQPFFYLPLARAGGKNRGTLLTVSHPSIYEAKSITRLFTERALNHLAENRPRDAVSDLLIACRLSEQIGNNGEPISFFMKTQILHQWLNTNKSVIQHPGLTIKELKEYRKQIQAINFPAKEDIAEGIVLYARCVVLDEIQSQALQDKEERNKNRSLIPIAKVLGLKAFDFDYIMENFNELYDESERVCKKPLREQIVIFRRMSQKINEKSIRHEGFRKIHDSPVEQAKFALLGIRERSDIYSWVLKDLLFSMEGYPKSLMRISLRHDLAMVHFSLELYKREKGIYPNNLEDLLPKYLTKIPQDPYAENEKIRYRSDGQSFRLYSVGRNGKDDHGEPFEKNGTAEADIILMVP